MAVLSEKIAPVVRKAPAKLVEAVKPEAIHRDLDGLIFVDGVYHIVFVWGASQLSAFFAVVLVGRFVYNHKETLVSATTAVVASVSTRRRLRPHSPVEAKRLSLLDKILVRIFFGK